jgi:hypothetical protein
LAAAVYEKSVLDTAHPFHDVHVAEKDVTIERVQKWIAEDTTVLTEAKAKVERIEAFIKKVADGEVKMSLASINQIAAEKLAKI